MLQSLRENMRGWVAYLLVGLIIVVFGLFGAEALFMGGLTQDTVAEVNGRKVTELDVRRAVEMRKQQLRGMLGENADPRFLSDEFLLPSVRESVIQQAVLASAVEISGLRTSDKMLDKTIVEDPTFHRNGKFDPEYYKSLLRQYAYTPASYRNELRKSELLNQYQKTFVSTAFVTEKEVVDLAGLQFETRDFSYVILPLEKTLAGITVSEEEIITYYQQHQNRFMSDAQAAVEYILLDKNALMAAIQVTEEDIQAQYQAEITEAEDKTERHVAHILIEEKSDGSHKALLDEVTKKIAAGEDFSALAKTYSADAGSAAQGGDVGTTTGDSFVPEFEQALKKLAVGNISEPVKTPFGYHIIKLLDQKMAKLPTLEESRVRIVQAIKMDLVEEQYAEKIDLLKESTKRAVNLGIVANELSSGLYNIESRQTALFSRKDPAALFASHPLLRSPRVMDAVFAEGVQAGTVTEVLELGSGNALVMRMTEFQAAMVQPLELVRTQVSEQLRRERAGEQLNVRANEWLQKLLANVTMDSLAASERLVTERVTRKYRNDSTVDPDILRKAFSILKPVGGNSVAADTLQLGNGDWALVEVLDIRAPLFEILTAEQQSQVSNHLQNRVRNDEFSALLAMLTEEADIKRRKQAANAL